ncbi:unnamed protein product [Mytilus coruscus]|uniref:Uncharacterized protein n=1 Tax=Mytilus coruscus TaxID=42192 RepID=A0A6J8CGF5_MYTCO|nr:unnamed protein product [Mytilus coruscus]
MDTPTEICSVDYGHIYVSGQGSDNIHRLIFESKTTKIECVLRSSMDKVERSTMDEVEQDYKVLDIPLDSRHGIKEPVALCFNQDYNYSEYTVRPQLDFETSSAGSGAIAGGCVSPITFLIVTLVVICRLRRIGPFIEKKNDLTKTPYNNETNTDQEIKRKQEINHTYGIVNDEIGIHSMDTNKVGQTICYAQVNKNRNIEDTYIESVDGEYDHFNLQDRRRKETNQNTYDSNIGIRSCDDPTYDTTSSSRKIRSRKSKSSQNTARRDLFGITWNRAKDACKPYGLENRADHLRSSGIRDENEFWIGKAIYSVPTRWFEIIGCFQIAENHIHSFPTVASIGYCKQKCDSENMGSYFGYRQKIRNIPLSLSIDTEIKTQNTFYTINNGKEEHVNISPDPLFPHGTDKRSYQSTGLVIGGVLGAFSMITVLVVLIVCKVRSKGMFTVSNTRDYEDTHRENFQQTTYQDLDNTNQMSLTATSNQTSGIDESSVPVYEEINQSVR